MSIITETTDQRDQAIAETGKDCAFEVKDIKWQMQEFMDQGYTETEAREMVRGVVSEDCKTPGSIR